MLVGGDDEWNRKRQCGRHKVRAEDNEACRNSLIYVLPLPEARTFENLYIFHGLLDIRFVSGSQATGSS